LIGKNNVIIASIAKELDHTRKLYYFGHLIFLKFHFVMNRWPTQLIMWDWETMLSKLQKVRKRSQENAWWFPLYCSWSLPSSSYSLFWNHGRSNQKRGN